VESGAKGHTNVSENGEEMSELVREVLGERLYKDAQAYADATLGGDVERFFVLSVLKQLDPAKFDREMIEPDNRQTGDEL